MNKHALFHRAKSNMAYAYDKQTIHIWLQAAKDDLNDIELIWGDPFCWGPDERTKEYRWMHESADSSKMEKKYQTDLYDYFFIAIKPTFFRMKYAFLIKKDGTEFLYGCREIYDLSNDDGTKRFNLFNFFNFPYLNFDDIIDTPKWVKDTVWYQIFPERFCNGDPSINPKETLEWNSTLNVKNSMRFGGDLQGIINKLDYIQDLGITGIYCNPIFKSPTNHKYDTTDYMQIDPEFGTNELFKKLVDEAHKRGIKIMLDAVFNHCGWFHPFFQDVLKKGKDSKYYECFFVRQEPMFNFPIKDGLPEFVFSKEYKQIIPNYSTFAFTPFMPKWNTESRITRDYLLGATRYWMENYDIDGWRLDVSNEVSHSFWREFKSLVRSINKNALILGENWDNSSPWLQGDQMDAVMNYELLFPMWQFFTFDKSKPKINASEFKYLVNKVLVSYQANVLENMFNLVDCHDTARMYEMVNLNKDLFKMTYTFLFTFTGSPNVYYGDEVGIAGGNDPDNRRCMEWDEKKQDLELKDYIKKLIKMRKLHSSCKSVDIIWYETNDKTNHIVYGKKSNDESMIVFMNNSLNTVDVNIPKEFANKKVKDAIFEIDVYLKNDITLAPYQTLVFYLNNN